MNNKEKRNPLLDTMSRSERNLWKTFSTKCIRFSVCGILILLTTCSIKSQDHLHLQNPGIVLMILVGAISLLIGCSGLIATKYICKQEGETYYEK